MSSDRPWDGLLLRGKPPYPWWQWVLVAVVWGGAMFLVFAALTGFKEIGLTAAVFASAGALLALFGRWRIGARERQKAD